MCRFCANRRYTEKADVYSFGIDMWELLTRATPFAGLQPMQVCLRNVRVVDANVFLAARLVGRSR